MLLPYDEFLKLPIITLKGLEGNQPADYSPTQLLLLPHVEIIQTIWWVCFITTLAFLFTRYFIWPHLIKSDKAAITPTDVLITDVQPFAPKKEHHQYTWLARLKHFYIFVFSLQEVAQDVALRLFGGAILIGYLATFSDWQFNPASTVDGVNRGQALCWPFFQSCSDWIWLRTLPDGYSQTTLFMVLFAVMMVACYGLLARKVVLAHACILFLFIVKMYLVLVVFWYNGNYDYYHNAFNIVFLFLPYKRFFASFVLVWLYFLSTATKIHPSWIWSGYFAALKGGLPLAPRNFEIFYTNLVIFMEMVMAWFLFSHRVWLQRSVFAFFCIFHIYSGILVGYHYPTIVMPTLLIMFGTLFRPFGGVPLSRTAMVGW